MYDHPVSHYQCDGGYPSRSSGAVSGVTSFYPYRPSPSYGSEQDSTPNFIPSPFKVGYSTPDCGTYMLKDDLQGHSTRHNSRSFQLGPKQCLNPCPPQMRMVPATYLTSTPSSSEGYATDCSSASKGSSADADYSSRLPHTLPTSFTDYVPTRTSLEASPEFPLPPPAYADAPLAQPYYSPGEVICYPRDNDVAVSDIFSQQGSVSDVHSLESSPGEARDLDHRPDEDVGNLTLSSEYQSPFDDITAPEDVPDVAQEISTRTSFATSHISPVSSPIAKRGRFSSCSTPGGYSADTTSVKTALLDRERYHNEYSKDIYEWLCFRETTVHAIGAGFMDAQKKDGASRSDRRAVVMRALIDMKKRNHTLEAIHLGFYIMDKCLDSFHIAKDTLLDVCAVSMVLGTKMEEYESLRPGNANGLFGATTDRARLCDIEKRIVHEMQDGLCFPTPLVFAHYILVELECNDEQIRLAQYLLDLALLDADLRDEGGPRVAHAAVCISSTVVRQRNSTSMSEGEALLEMEHKLSKLTKIPVGATRSVMRKLVLEMDRAVREKHAILVDYLSEDNKRVCFCEVSPPLWDILHNESKVER